MCPCGDKCGVVCGIVCDVVYVVRRMGLSVLSMAVSELASACGNFGLLALRVWRHTLIWHSADLLSENLSIKKYETYYTTSG